MRFGRILRVHAEGGQGIAAATGMLASLDKKPDPYITIIFNKETYQSDVLDDVEPLLPFTWPNAIKEFQLPDTDDDLISKCALTIHVKDKDIGSSRYIGGTTIALGTLLTKATPSADGNTILCRSQWFPLEYSDEKLTKKKASGEVKLTISLIDKTKKEQAVPIVQAAQVTTTPSPTEQATPVTTVPVPTVPVTTVATAKDKEMVPAESVPTKTVEEKPIATKKLSQRKMSAVEPPIVASDVAKTSTTVTDPTSTSAARKPTLQKQPTLTLKSDPIPISAVQATNTTPLALPESTNALATAIATTNIAKAMHVELVSARNLTRPMTLGGFIDRKPDPMVSIEFNDMKQRSAALKDVDLKKPIEWTQGTMLTFDLSSLSTKLSMDLKVHIQDENYTKPTYMGGGPCDLSDLFDRSPSALPWTLTSSTANGSERIVPLVFSDEKWKKKKNCGEITLRFHFEMIPRAIEAIVETSSTTSVVSKDPAEASNVKDVMSKDPVEASNVKDVVSKNSIVLNPEVVSTVSSVPVDNVPSTMSKNPSETLCTDIKSLSIEALCGRNLVKPKGTNVATSLLKSVFDRKPDPFVTFVLGNDTKRCHGVQDVDVAFFEWKQAIQVFELTSKPYPIELLVHVRDDDVGKDPYMGGARILMNEIWNVIQTRKESEWVATYPLVFTDEQMTKQKACGTITLRFRWIYAERELPIESIPIASVAPELPRVEPRMGYLAFRKMALYNHKELLDPSWDLYVQMTTSSSTKVHETDVTTSRVLNDTMKGQAPDARVEWIGDELIVPWCGPMQTPSSMGVHIRIKDKNAVMKDTDIATTVFQVQDHVTSHGEKEILVCLNLEIGKKTVKWEAMVQFTPLGSPRLATATTLSSGILTIFLIQSILHLKTPTSTSFSIQIEPITTKKKKSLLSFGGSEPAFASTTHALEPNHSIAWWECANLGLTEKQVASTKEKEVMQVEIHVYQHVDGKSKRMASVELNLASVFESSASLTRIETFSFGPEMGTMTLEFATAFRTIQTQQVDTTIPTVLPVPNGNLHVIILSARQLVSPDPTLETNEQLDPEVRLAIEPKYIKRKDHPVRSMLKTKPIENSGVVPTWNEYLRLEYRLPSLPSTESITFPPPILQISIVDIQVPGERNTSQVIGKAELPLSAFIPTLDTSPQSIVFNVDVFLGEKKTGILTIEGIFESLTPSEAAGTKEKIVPNTKESPADIYRRQCRTLGRDLREKAKKLKAGELSPDDPVMNKSKRMGGRLEMHLIGARGSGILQEQSHGIGACCWISSNLEDRKDIKSRTSVISSLQEMGCVIQWDAKHTLYTNDIMSEMLRIEVVTDTGKSMGSLKIPLNGVQGRPIGQVVQEWHVLETHKPKEKTKGPNLNEVLLGLSFFSDQMILNPLTCVRVSEDKEQPAVVVVQCRRLIPIDSNGLASDVEVACKCSLLGGVVETTGPCTSSFQLVKESCVTWNEIVKLEIGTTPSSFLTQSLDMGCTPLVRIEILSKRKGARFQESMACVNLSLFALLQCKGSVQRYLHLYKSSNKTQVWSVLDLQLLVCPITASIETIFQTSTRLPPVPGVLCIRFASGRNLLDVDANGEQDPYVMAQIHPSSFSVSSCQTNVSMNGGRHPQWQSSIYELYTPDLLTDYLRLECMDSNEEDHLADVYIGAIDIALTALFPSEQETLWNIQTRTKWLETWVPIYPVLGNQEMETTGEVRIEYRFLCETYYDTASQQNTTSTPASPYTSDLLDMSSQVEGMLHVHIVQANHLNMCTKGSQPGIRLTQPDTTFFYLTKPGQQSLQDPVWDQEIAQIPISFQGKKSVCLSIEVVDLAVRTANVNALAVLSFGTANVTSFISHPMATSYHVFSLSQGATCPSVVLGCQFIPKGKEGEIVSRSKALNGQIHIQIKTFQIHLSSYWDHMLMNKTLFLRLYTETNEKILELPILSTLQVITQNGKIPWTIATLLDYQRPESQRINPFLYGTLLDRSTNGDQEIGTLQLPLFDYVLFDGHLLSAWFPIDSNDVEIGRLELQVQFLPTPVVEKKDSIILFSIDVETVSGISDTSTVLIELLGCQHETRPNVNTWNETLDFPIPQTTLQGSNLSPILQVQVRKATLPQTILGICTWVLPQELCTIDPMLSHTTDEIRLVLQSPATNQSKKKEIKAPEIKLRLRRSPLEAPINKSPTQQRRGLFYIVYDEGTTPSIVQTLLVPAEQAKDPMTLIKTMSRSIQLISTERRVVPVYDDLGSPEQVMFFTVGKGSSVHAYATMGNRELLAITRSANMEVFHQLPVYTLEGAQKSSKPLYSLPCRFVYVDIVQGQLEIKLKRLTSVRSTKGMDKYQVEMRLIQSKSPWVQSDLASRQSKTGDITWKDTLTLMYSNVEEQMEPVIQIGLQRAVDGGTPTKQAFGQVPILQILTGKTPDVFVPLAINCTNVEEDSISPTLEIEIRYLRHDVLSTEKEALERETRVLALAEGTAQLKKTFALLGGDESTPVTIKSLKSYLTRNQDGNAFQVLQKAADTEMDGDLDRLFNAMDVNGDGAISWDEYVDHMQNVYALAHIAEQESTTRVKNTEVKQEEKKEEEEEAEEDEEERDKDPIEQSEEEEEEEEFDLYEKVVVQPLQPVVNPPPQVLATLTPTPSIARTEQVKEDKRKTVVRPPDPDTIRRKSIVQALSQPPAEIPSKPVETKRRTHRFKSLLSTNVIEWKVDDVIQWLVEEMELEQYVDAIHQNAVNGKLLLTLQEQELESELGIHVPLHRRKVWNQIQEFQQLFLPSRTVKKKEQPIKPSETPSFIKREQLIYQEKQKQTPVIVGPKTLGQTRTFPTTTTLKQEKESYDDALADIYEAVCPESPRKQRFPFPIIQIGSIVNTDELIEIVRKRMHQVSSYLLPIAQSQQETHSDFGTDADESVAETKEPSALQLAFQVFQGDSHRSTTTITRLRFQQGLETHLFLQVSWHQFDMLFRRIDMDQDGELCWEEFQQAFESSSVQMDASDLVFLQQGLVDAVLERLETQQWTLIEVFKAFDRDGNGTISIAEFSTLIRFLCQGKKRHVYLLLSCLDQSTDRRISQQEFLRFFFIVWSRKLMEIQDQLVVTSDELLRQKKHTLRRALRTNFSRPFRDAMRCMDVNVPGPFTGLLERLQLVDGDTTSDQTMQVWQVLQGQTHSTTRLVSSPSNTRSEVRPKRTNQVLRTKLTRQREPERSNAILQTPKTHIPLDEHAKLKYDYRHHT